MADPARPPRRRRGSRAATAPADEAATAGDATIVPDAPSVAAGDAGGRIVVALDGPASSGKSSVGAAAAARLGLRFVDTGLLYRALTAAAIRAGVATDDAAALVPLADRVTLADDGTGRLTRVLLDGVDATDEARGPAVDAEVSRVSRIPDVRAALLPRQRALAEPGGIVVAGRDIGTVVLPEADLKLFLDASVEERAARRISERGLDPQGEEAEAVRAQLRSRDEQDRNRAVAPLRAAQDAVIIETDGNPFERTVDIVVNAIRNVQATISAGPLPAPSPTPPGPAREPVADPRARAAAGAGGSMARRRRSDVAQRAMNLDNRQTMLVRLIALMARIGLRLFSRMQVEGLEHVPRSGAVILAANHLSNADSVPIAGFITPALRRRRIHWMGKREMFDWPVLGWIFARFGVHPVERGTADVEAFRLASRILEAGYVLIIFPEGTRSADGALQEAKDGLATLALRSDAVIVPIGLNNTDRLWPRGQALPLPLPRRTITMRVGEPFRVAELVPPDADRRAAKALATTAIMGRIAELLDPRHRGAYADAMRPAGAPPD